MSRWQAWRARQSDLDFQTKRADWLDGQLTRLETELKLARKETSEGIKRFERFALRHSDMMAQKAGLVPAFVKDSTPEQPKPPEFAPEDESRILFLAQANMEADGNQQPLEFYVDKLKAMPNYNDLVLN